MPVLAILGSFRTWECTQDEHGYRDYKVTFEVIADPTYGPAKVLECPGLPTVGSTWDLNDDTDEYVYCKLAQSAKPRINDGEPTTIWDVDFVFSSRPDLEKCETVQFTNPLLQCPKISGHSTRRTREETLDFMGNPIINSAFEQIRGPNNEWDSSRTGVRVEMNVDSGTVAIAINCLDYVNSETMWGQPPRCVKLSNVNWTKKYYGACETYFSLIMDFEIETYQPTLSENYVGPYYAQGITVGSWDRLVLDEGTKVLKGRFDSASGQYKIAYIAGVPTPTSAPTLSQGTGGSLGNATYYYKVTAVSAQGVETNASPAGSITVAGGGGTASVVININYVPGAASFNIYGRPNTLTGTYGLIGSTATGTSTFTDTGGTTGVSPPATNGTLVPANHLNPQHFTQYLDQNNNPAKCMLNGAGLPADVSYSTGTSPGTITGPGHILIQYYPQVDFSILSIPSDYLASCNDTATEG